MSLRHCRSFLPVLAVFLISIVTVSISHGQDAKHPTAESRIPEHDGPSDAGHASADHIRERDEWFFRGRIIHGKPSAELRRGAYQAKRQMRAQRAAALAAARANGVPSPPSVAWAPLGPVPLASDATGNGTQNYNQVAGRATAVAIDPADPTGNTVYVGGAQAGLWKSTNAANVTANSVTWTAVADDQATLSIGALAIQPGNTNPAQTLILAATGEANNSADSYFGLGILRSADAGNTWTLISTANGGALSFNGLGGTRMAFSTASNQTNTVVSAMATTSEGMIDGAVTANTTRGLYTSLDAGQTWTYNALTDPGGNPTDATSATSVVYNATGAQFFAAIRYHGFYSSPDGVNWTRLATQPGGAVLSTTACPPQSTSNNYACPIYRGEITVVPGRSEMYAWYVSLDSSGNPVDGGIWQSLDGGNTWTSIPDASIANCGDLTGCGVEQGTYNLELLAVPNASGTDLYAGAINLYKCSINSQNPTCSSAPFINLTHVYGCDPIAAPSHVHAAQHALAYMIPSSGGDSGGDLMYFANDGGIYRALDGFAGLTTGSCSGTNQFDDLNQNLGSMTQFVSFSQHPSDPDTLLGGTQDNGSPATSQATTSSAWINVLGGDGGYNAIDPNAPTNFYASNPDIPPGDLGIQLCSSGVNCTDGAFSFVVTSGTVGGDDGAFYFPYILDAKSQTALLVGTCRVWRGPRTGGSSYTVLSPNFDTLGSGTCSGSEVNLVRAIAAGGPTDPNGSLVVYATTSGLGPLEGSFPVGGQVWITTNATAGPLSFANVTNNGPQGSINSNQFPVSSVATDTSDPKGATAYVTVMGFTGGTGHVWKTTNAGVSWTDFTANLPDSPVNAVVVDPVNADVYVGTDVGVFVSSTSSASWSELGPNPDSGQSGFLPNVAVTALGLFNSSGEELLRASTYGRGVWQFPIAAVADYRLAISNSPLNTFSGQDGLFDGTATSVNGYNGSVTLSCVAGTTTPPSTCAISPSTLIPGTNTPFTVTVDGAIGTYSFDIQGVGPDPKQDPHLVPVTLNILAFGLTTPSPASVTVPRGTSSSPVTFQVTAAGSFNQSVTVSCNPGIANATCTLTPGNVVNPTANDPVTMTASVAVPVATPPTTYDAVIQATTADAPAPLSTGFTLNVTTNPDFVLSEPSPFPEVNAGSRNTKGPIAISSQDGFAGTVSLSCSTTFGASSCSISPPTVDSFPATATLTINGASFAPGSYAVTITGTSGSDTHTLLVPFNVGDYSISGPQSLNVNPGGQGMATLILTPMDFYSGKINATCDDGTLSGAQCVISPNPVSVANGGTANLTVTINVPNNAASGQYNITVGTQDTTGAPSHNYTIALEVTADFIVTASIPTSQTVNPGQTTGPYSLTVQAVGSVFNAPVTLSCSGLPPGAQCLFNPSTPVIPGTAGADVVLSISTSSSTNYRRPARQTAMLSAASLLLPGIVIVWRVSRNPRKHKLMGNGFFVMLILLSSGFFLLSCGGASTGGGGGSGTCSATPSVPIGLTATSLTATSLTLDWNQSSATVGCNVIYTVYEGIGTATPSPIANSNTTNTTFAVTGLTADTQYSFQVAATDTYAASAPSSPALQVTTPGTIYTITVTGTSAGTPSDPGQSTQVTLVVN